VLTVWGGQIGHLERIVADALTGPVIENSGDTRFWEITAGMTAKCVSAWRPRAFPPVQYRPVFVPVIAIRLACATIKAVVQFWRGSAHRIFAVAAVLRVLWQSWPNS
jgi:hypothetical protein